MENIIIIAVVALIVGLALGYIYKEKKKGKACIGCPFAGSCGSGTSSEPEQSCCCPQKNH